MNALEKLEDMLRRGWHLRLHLRPEPGSTPPRFVVTLAGMDEDALLRKEKLATDQNLEDALHFAHLKSKNKGEA